MPFDQPAPPVRVVGHRRRYWSVAIFVLLVSGAGVLILLSSPGGDLNQAAIIGEIIRARGLTTAVGIADAAGRVKPSYCASACVLVFAGGNPRFGVLGSALGVHRFVTTKPVGDP